MEQLTGDLNLLAGFFLESLGGLLGGAFLLPAIAALVVGLVILTVMIIRELVTIQDPRSQKHYQQALA